MCQQSLIKYDRLNFIQLSTKILFYCLIRRVLPLCPKQTILLFSKRGLLVTTVLSFFFVVQASAQYAGSCGDLFSVAHKRPGLLNIFNSKIKSAPEPIHRLLKSRIVDRLWDNPISKQVTDQVFDPSLGEDHKSPILVSSYVTEKGVLEIDIPNIESNSAEGYGTKSKGLDVTFAAVVVGILRAAQMGGEQGNIHSVRIVASMVINPELVKMLKSYGFRREKEGLHQLGFDYVLLINLL